MITVERIKEVVVEAVTGVEIDDVADIETDANLRRMGIDSMDLFAIVLALQEMSGIEVPDEDVEQLKSVQDLYDYFNSRM